MMFRFTFPLFITLFFHSTITAQVPRSDAEKGVLEWFVDMQLPNGLVPSSNSSGVSLYDNALAAMVFMIYDKNARAEAIFDFFDDRLQTEFSSGKGGFAQFRDRNGNPLLDHQWMGDNAWLLIALNNYHDKTGTQKYEQLAQAITQWLVNLQDCEGGLYGGFSNGQLITNQVTEGMIDAFNAVFGHTDFHSDIISFLTQQRWDPNLSSFTTGWDAYNYALDIHPWSFCALLDFPVATLTAADMYLVTATSHASGNEVTGYCFDLDKDNIWYEGVGEMVVAFNVAGLTDKADSYLTELEKAMITGATPNSYGIPYVSNGSSTRFGSDPISTTEYTEPFVSSGAWYLFGIKKFNPFGVGRKVAVRP